MGLHRPARPGVAAIARFGARHQRQHMRIRQHARHEVGMGVGGELVVLALHAADHRSHDVTQQRRHALDFLIEHAGRHDRELTE